jgi:hypothetical protein
MPSPPREQDLPSYCLLVVLGLAAVVLLTTAGGLLWWLA